MKTIITIIFQFIFLIWASLFSNLALSFDNFQPRLDKNLGAFQPRADKKYLQNPALSSEDFQAQLDAKLAEYHILSKSPNVKSLVEMDRDIKNLISKIYKAHGNEYSDTKQYWRDEYEQIGMFIGHYSDGIGYSEKLLVDAHKLNPRPPYRKHTLYTTILGERSFHGLGEMPDIKAAKQYLKEFPTGPYAADANEILGYFYDDLYKVLLNNKKHSKHEKDYTDECFAPYISEAPYKEQLSVARALAISHLKKAIAINPKNEMNEHRKKTLNQ